MRILWYSAPPWVKSGYGNQTELFVRRFAEAGHQVSIAATWGHGGEPLSWNDITVYPASEHHAMPLVPLIATREKPDVTIALLDAWVLDPDAFRRMNFAVWTPVDHRPAPPRVVKFFKDSGARTIAMSKFGREMLAAEGLDPLYVPHGVDTNIFRPAPDRAELRHAMKIPDEAFVVGMVANNMSVTPPRKAFPQVIMAFSIFREKHPDAVLYFHSEMYGKKSQTLPGVNLPDLCDRYGVPPKSVHWVNQVDYALDLISAEQMAALYNTFDVLINPSYGEGFGIPIVEAQACGTPVIVSDWTSMTELCGAGWLVDGEPIEDVPQRALYLSPSVASILEQMENAYAAKGDMGLRARAREFALQYDADLVYENYWVPALERLARGREVPPLPNRAMRRAQKKAAA